MHQRHLPMSLSTPHLSSAPALLRQHPAFRGHFALILSCSQRSMLFFLLGHVRLSACRLSNYFCLPPDPAASMACVSVHSTTCPVCSAPSPNQALLSVPYPCQASTPVVPQNVYVRTQKESFSHIYLYPVAEFHSFCTQLFKLTKSHLSKGFMDLKEGF